MLRVSEDGNRRREGYLANYNQLRDSLLGLESAADKIFDTISERTAKESEKLTNISKRIQNAKAKIDRVSDSKKESIAIRSSSKYPTHSAKEKDFQSIFGYKDGPSTLGLPVAQLIVNGGLNREAGADGTLELFQFFSETSSDFLPKEDQKMASSAGGCSSENASIENFLEPPNFTFSKYTYSLSFVLIAHFCMFLNGLLKEVNKVADSPLNNKHQMLPPPPPSLLLNLQNKVEAD